MEESSYRNQEEGSHMVEDRPNHGANTTHRHPERVDGSSPEYSSCEKLILEALRLIAP